jgi:hypothetical protein
MPRHPDGVACIPGHLLTRSMSCLAFDTRLASGLMSGAPKVRICTVQRFGLRHLPPQMKNQRGSMRKNLNRIKNDLSTE